MAGGVNGAQAQAAAIPKRIIEEPVDDVFPQVVPELIP
jgi:hypothetical protein